MKKIWPGALAIMVMSLLPLTVITIRSKEADLALQIVEGLGVHSPEHPTLTPVPSEEFVLASLEREAVRRIFWLIHLLDVIASIYFKKPVTFTESELRLRLPVDETSFEMGVHSTLPGECSSRAFLSFPLQTPQRDGIFYSCPRLFPPLLLIPLILSRSILASSHPTPLSSILSHVLLILFNVDLNIEYLYLPAVKTQYASEFGHLIRILSIYAKVEHALDEMNGSCSTFLLHSQGSQMLLIAPEILGNPAASLMESEQKMEVCPFLFSCLFLVSPSNLYRNGFAHFQNTFASRSKVCRFSNRCSKQAQILARGVGATCMSTTPRVHLP